MKCDYTVVDAREMSGLADQGDLIAQTVWPEFMLHDPVAGKFWHLLYQNFPEYQFALVSAGDVLAVGNSIPLYWDRGLSELPEEGWDWILPKAAEDLRGGNLPNLQVAIQVMVAREHQQKGLSAPAVAAMADIGRRLGHRQLVVPVRPTRKTDYPEVPMQEYVGWVRSDGVPFDPWVRVHARLGGSIVKVCHRSMHITGSLEEWQRWTGITFQTSGATRVPGALSPVMVDMAKQTADYVEPNVWMVHELGEKIG